MTSEYTQVTQALSRARMLTTAAKLRLKELGPACAKVYTALEALEGDEQKAFFASGRGWIVQGAPGKALDAFYAILKACLILGESAVAVGWLGDQLYAPASASCAAASS